MLRKNPPEFGITPGAGGNPAAFGITKIAEMNVRDPGVLKSSRELALGKSFAPGNGQFSDIDQPVDAGRSKGRDQVQQARPFVADG